jgi:hypothetical protein
MIIRHADFATTHAMRGGDVMIDDGAEDIGQGSRPNWREPANYKALLTVDRAGWAWTWLRRNPDYIARMAGRAPTHPLVLPGSGVPILSAADGDDASAWGCTFAEMPSRRCAEARIFWRSDWDASVVAVEARPISAGDADASHRGGFGRWATVLQPADGGESLLLSDGTHRLQLEITSGTLLAGPVCLRYEISGFRHVEPKTLTLRRLLLLCRLGRFPLGLFPPEPRARRWVLALQAYDGMRAGASQRDIAVALFGEKAVRDDWCGRSEYLRLRVQRLLQLAHRLVTGGYRELLK